MGVPVMPHITVDYVDWFIDFWDLYDQIPGNQEAPGGTPFMITYHGEKKLRLFNEYECDGTKSGTP